jgi:hypothetical protein
MISVVMKMTPTGWISGTAMIPMIPRQIPPIRTRSATNTVSRTTDLALVKLRVPSAIFLMLSEAMTASSPMFEIYVKERLLFIYVFPAPVNKLNLRLRIDP